MQSSLELIRHSACTNGERMWLALLSWGLSSLLSALLAAAFAASPLQMRLQKIINFVCSLMYDAKMLKEEVAQLEVPVQAARRTLDSLAALQGRGVAVPSGAQAVAELARRLVDEAHALMRRAQERPYLCRLSAGSSRAAVARITRQLLDCTIALQAALGDLRADNHQQQLGALLRRIQQLQHALDAACRPAAAAPAAPPPPPFPPPAGAAGWHRAGGCLRRPPYRQQTKSSTRTSAVRTVPPHGTFRANACQPAIRPLPRPALRGPWPCRSPNSASCPVARGGVHAADEPAGQAATPAASGMMAGSRSGSRSAAPPAEPLPPAKATLGWLQVAKQAIVDRIRQ